MTDTWVFHKVQFTREKLKSPSRIDGDLEDTPIDNNPKETKEFTHMDTEMFKVLTSVQQDGRAFTLEHGPWHNDEIIEL